MYKNYSKMTGVTKLNVYYRQKNATGATAGLSWQLCTLTLYHL